MISTLSKAATGLLHIDRSLGQITADYGQLTYFLLFLVVFCETGLIVTPFLPGDSLLFAAGALAALGHLDIWILLVLFLSAAILGDWTNYLIGRSIGERVLREEKLLFVPIKKEYIQRTETFFAKHGGKAIILARFMPIIRTGAPFVAGVAKMTLKEFFFYNVAGAVLWVSSFLAAGYFFGNIPVVKERFSLIVLAIVVVSFAPAVIEFVRMKFPKKTR